MASSTSNSQDGRGKAVTPPKGRPTRARGAVADDRRVFGPVAQWIALALLVVAVVLVLIFVTGGGEFDVPGGGHSGSIVAPILGALGA